MHVSTDTVRSFFSISKQLVSSSVFSEVVLSDLHMTRAEFGASASAAESNFLGLNFHAAKMLPQIGDWLFVLRALPSLAFLPTIAWLFHDVLL